MIKKYTVVYKESDSVDEEIKFYEYLGPYQLWVILSKVENRFIILQVKKTYYLLNIMVIFGIVLILID